MCIIINQSGGQSGHVSMERTSTGGDGHSVAVSVIHSPIFLASVLSCTEAAFIAKMVVCVSLSQSKREKATEGLGGLVL